MTGDSRRDVLVPPVPRCARSLAGHSGLVLLALGPDLDKVLSGVPVGVCHGRGRWNLGGDIV